MATRIPLIKAINMKGVYTRQVADHIVFREFAEADHTKLSVRSLHDMSGKFSEHGTHTRLVA